MNIYSYSNKSLSVKLLANELGFKLIKHKESSFVGNKDKIVINWGCTDPSDEVKKCKVINSSQSVKLVVDRKQLFTILTKYFDTPPFTSDKQEADGWVNAGGSVFEQFGVYIWDVKPTSVCRIHVVSGIVVASQLKSLTEDKIPDATKELIKRTAVEVLDTLGLHFGAITVGWNKHTSRHYVLNVNTAPKLDEELAKKYAKVFKEVV